jgi:hypothetical protein
MFFFFRNVGGHTNLNSKNVPLGTILFYFWYDKKKNSDKSLIFLFVSKRRTYVIRAYTFSDTKVNIYKILFSALSCKWAFHVC